MKYIRVVAVARGICMESPKISLARTGVGAGGNADRGWKNVASDDRIVGVGIVVMSGGR
jgi:hypothetical protein